MNKFFLSSCLVAGTAVGAGMIALPMVLCKIGPLFTVGLILSIWLLMYFSSLMGLELNLRSGQGLSLGKLGQLYSGPLASLFGSISLMLLIYALQCAYLHGGASILQKFLITYFDIHFSLNTFIFGGWFLVGTLLLNSVVMILRINRFLLMGLLGAFAFLMVGLTQKMNLTALPLFEPFSAYLSSWTQAIPLLSTSFGFQVILHTLTKFGDQDPKLLKRSIFWGSLVPAGIYILWTLSTLSILYVSDIKAYYQLQAGQLEVGQFIEALARTTTWPTLQRIASLISLGAILKSFLGVSLALREAWEDHFQEAKIWGRGVQKQGAFWLTMLPALGIGLFVPQLFLKALTFAGMVSAIIAILLPYWLITRPSAQAKPIYYPLAAHRGLQIICLAFGFMIILCELYNLI